MLMGIERVEGVGKPRSVSRIGTSEEPRVLQSERLRERAREIPLGRLRPAARLLQFVIPRSRVISYWKCAVSRHLRGCDALPGIANLRLCKIWDVYPRRLRQSPV